MFKRTWIDEIVEVSTNADTLYSLLKDVDGWPTWTRGLRQIKRKNQEAFGVGTRFTMVLDPGISLPCEMYRYDPSYLEWGGGRGSSVVRHRFEITPIDATRCRLHHAEYATGALALIGLPFEGFMHRHDHQWTETIRTQFTAAYAH